MATVHIKGEIIPFNRDVIPREKFCPEALKRWDLQTQRAGCPDHVTAETSVVSDLTEDVTAPTTSGNSNSTERITSSTNGSVNHEEVVASSSSNISFESLLLSTTPPVKPSKKKQQSESSSENKDPEGVSVQNSDNDNEFLANLRNPSPEPEIMVEQFPQINKWVLVEYSTKKTRKHYVGQITDRDEMDRVIKYLRPKGGRFISPQVDDVDTVEENNQVLKAKVLKLENALSKQYANNIKNNLCISGLSGNVKDKKSAPVELIKLFTSLSVPVKEENLESVRLYDTPNGPKSLSDSMKVATVTPIPKINNPGSFSDLRPISLLPTLSKIFEKAIYIQLVSYLNDSNLIPPTRSDFRKGYSAASVLLSVLDDIISAADEGRTSALIMLDYSKAFDALDHIYLVDRSQFVSMNGNQSEAKFTTKGVPQGSILGPLLFIIYTMDIAVDDNHCKMHRYADDTQLHLSFRKSEAYEAQNKVEQCLEKIYTYSSKNGLKLNPTKNTPHALTNKSPAELMFNRRLRCKLDLLIPKNQEIISDKIQKQVEYKNSSVKNFNLGDKILLRDFKNPEHPT
ncbi:uncharacterized protein LOC115890915 [Sitophilus oryzae]|uniref:Uncharacterized protein LOC115890915 n=1 Tax=Sitophilus oryzae TaxID=7048 RepID=A0A6J2YV26_SITOR|nr:uncharacterized protein LOC115890915 [Sitophilus oryzae]